ATGACHFLHEGALDVQGANCELAITCVIGRLAISLEARRGRSLRLTTRECRKGRRREQGEQRDQGRDAQARDAPPECLRALPCHAPPRDSPLQRSERRMAAHPAGGHWTEVPAPDTTKVRVPHARSGAYA